ncbi:hypothetical protein [uncultured Streptomyces sp.]|uniref:hypothetical protein n=1 Tax=uncultured Streptomyces sp. TaxID=174707 RepID=UPI002630C00F|nr:hypothetical protein [uncultured Streptomyces sp.]
MSTTRHLVNRRRRLATAATERPAAPPRGTGTATVDPDRVPAPEADAPADAKTRTGAGKPGAGEAGTGAATQEDAREQAGQEEAEGETPVPRARRLPRPRVTLPVVLCALTVLLGAFAAWSAASAASLRDEPSRQNTALTDIARTSEVKGQITQAVGAVFSYDYASTAKADRAASTYLTGKAVQQHQDMLAEVRAQAPKQKLVLTTTVTESAVEVLDGDRARLLIFADQSNTRTGAKEETTYAAAMFAVDAVRRGDTWKIAAIDTFTR